MIRVQAAAAAMELVQKLQYVGVKPGVAPAGRKCMNRPALTAAAVLALLRSGLTARGVAEMSRLQVPPRDPASAVSFEVRLR